MADISKIKINNFNYDIKDAKCRAELEALIGSDTLAGDVDTIKEIQAFLAGIDTDDPTLFNQLKSINDRIDAIEAVSGTVDDTLSSTSINPVQNKVIKGALDNKANKNELTVTAVTGDTTKKNIQLKSGTSQTVVVEHQDISGKQDKINDLSAIRSGAGKGATSVQTISVNGGTATSPTDGNIDITIPSTAWADVKPSGGVPKSDLASGVQTSLGKADSAIQGVIVNSTELTPNAEKKVSLSAVTGLQFDGSTHVGVVQLPEYVKKSDYDTAIAEYVKTSDYNTTIDDIYQSIPSDLADLADDETHRVVTDTEKSTWNGKQNALTFDNTPTKSSANPVKSGGVYSALADLYDGYDSSTETLSFTFPTE